MSTATRCAMCKTHDVNDWGACPHCDRACPVGQNCPTCAKTKAYLGTGPTDEGKPK